MLKNNISSKIKKPLFMGLFVWLLFYFEDFRSHRSP